MKVFLIFAILTTTLYSKAGGISGGGGGTIIPDAAGADYVYGRLASARSTLLAVFKHLHGNAMYSDLYAGEDNILKKIQRYSLNIKMDQPCYDFDGVPNDGSINSEPNTICLSAFTIGDKVSEMTAFPQLLALMAHEYSHLQGYDEIKAVELQKYILTRTKAVAESDEFSLVQRFMWASQQVGFLLEQSEMFYKNNPEKAYRLIARTEDEDLFQTRYPLSTIDNNELKIIYGIHYRLSNLREYGCTQQGSSKDDQEVCAIEYENIFKDADEISMKDYSYSHFGNADDVLDEKLPNLMKHPEKYFEEMKYVSEELSRITMTINEQFGIQY